MNRELIFTDNELNNNPLLRKMRERFTCSGNMTIGEIMLHRAERDRQNAATPATCMATSGASTQRAAAVEDPVRVIESPMRSARRSLILSCTAIALCVVVLLAFIIPIISNFGVDASTTTPDAEVVSATVETETAPVEEEQVTTSSFDRVMHSFSGAFGN